MQPCPLALTPAELTDQAPCQNLLVGMNLSTKQCFGQCFGEVWEEKFGTFAGFAPTGILGRTAGGRAKLLPARKQGGLDGAGAAGSKAAEGKREPLGCKNTISAKLAQYSLGIRLICNERHSNDVTNWSQSDLPGLSG